MFCIMGRYFVADNVLEEVTFGWPRQRDSFKLKEHLALGLERAIDWVPCFYEFEQSVPYQLHLYFYFFSALLFRFISLGKM